MTLLVAYATCHGSRRGVAEPIGTQVGRSAQDADVRTVRDVGDVGNYEAAILGSAIHGGKSHRAPRTAPAMSRHPSWS